MKINTDLDNLVQIRENTLILLEKHSESALEIPTGFKNSLLWNAAHSCVTMQLLVYHFSGLPMHVSQKWVDMYRKGTFAQQKENIAIPELKTLINSTVNQLHLDLKTDMFLTYKSYTTSFGITLNSAEEAISFNNIHEGLHLGYMMAMIKKT